MCINVIYIKICEAVNTLSRGALLATKHRNTPFVGLVSYTSRRNRVETGSDVHTLQFLVNERMSTLQQKVDGRRVPGTATWPHKECKVVSTPSCFYMNDIQRFVFSKRKSANIHDADWNKDTHQVGDSRQTTTKDRVSVKQNFPRHRLTYISQTCRR